MTTPRRRTHKSKLQSLYKYSIVVYFCFCPCKPRNYTHIIPQLRKYKTFDKDSIGLFVLPWPKTRQRFRRPCQGLSRASRRVVGRQPFRRAPPKLSIKFMGSGKPSKFPICVYIYYTPSTQVSTNKEARRKPGL